MRLSSWARMGATKGNGERMKAMLLPVHGFSTAKSRFAVVLSEGERAGLARAMYLDVVTAVLGARTLDRVAVLTSNAEVADMARTSGFEIFSDDLNRTIDRLAIGGTVITIPANLPTLSSIEIDVAINECGPALGLIPSADGTRTNATIMHANMTIEMSGGHGSLQRHLQACEAAKIPRKVLHVSGMAFDVDC